MPDQAEGLRALMSDPRRVQAWLARPAAEAAAHAGDGRPRRARTVVVTSGKGGVGKSNISVNLAVVSAQTGRRVVIVDADHGLANVDILCGVAPRLNLAHVLDDRVGLEHILAKGPGGIRIVPGASGLARMANPDRALGRRLLAILDDLKRYTDLIFVDTSPGIGADSLLTRSRSPNTNRHVSQSTSRNNAQRYRTSGTLKNV